MQCNIFKVKKLKELKEKMEYKGYKKIGKELISEKYKLNLFYKYDTDLKLSWKNILVEFGEDSLPTRTGISGIILCESNCNNYAITYGSSSYLVQKYSDKEFGFNLAKRIELKEIKRKSSMTPHSTKNSSITAFKNTKTIIYDSGENITSLSFTPEDEFYGKRIDIGKSIKLKTSLPLKDIHKILYKIESDSKNEIINNIPLLTRITDENDIEKYNKIMYGTLINEIESQTSKSQFSTSEFVIIGSSIYFEEECSQVIRINNKEFEYELQDLQDLYELSKKSDTSIQKIIEKGKIIYKNNDGEKIYTELISKFVNFEIDEENVTLYGGEWYYYNNDYYDLVINEVKSIKVIYDPSDNITRQKIELFRKKPKEYREEILNKILCNKHQGTLLDRDILISRYENEYFNSKYRIEISDLIINNNYISLKIGSCQSLGYCVDQSELSAKLIDNGKIDLKVMGYPEPKEYSLWFYMDNEKIFNGKKVEIERINSIMLLSKLSNWSKNIKTLGKTPVIRINKYSE